MVAFSSMGKGLFSGISLRFGDNLNRPISTESNPKDDTITRHLGILAFETAKTMSRIVSLYKSLSDDEISELKEAVKSEGVAYLNSSDENILLSLACAERLEDLDKAATAVARLGHKCMDFGLNRFDLVYTDLKLGIIDFGKLDYGSKDTEKRVKKMEKLISETSKLYSSLEALTELEISETKLKQWKSKSPLQQQHANLNHFNQKLEHQRKQVRQFRETSLWSQTFDKSVGLMARIICITYARLCQVFSPYIPVLPSVSLRNMRSSQQTEILRIQPEFCLIEPIKEKIISRSGPIPCTSKPSLVRFYSRKSILFLCEDDNFGAERNGKRNRVFHSAGPSTVGGSGLALHYANVIALAEKYLDSPVTISKDAREYLYEMLPENLKSLVRSKLSKNMRRTDNDEMLAEGWREALQQIMGWLLPMAQNTITWQLERKFEKMKFDKEPSVLLLQTLHFSDKEKTEAAIAEVLVGLSCIFRYESHLPFES